MASALVLSGSQSEFCRFALARMFAPSEDGSVTGMQPVMVADRVCHFPSTGSHAQSDRSRTPAGSGPSGFSGMSARSFPKSASGLSNGVISDVASTDASDARSFSSTLDDRVPFSGGRTSSSGVAGPGIVVSLARLVVFFCFGLIWTTGSSRMQTWVSGRIHAVCTLLPHPPKPRPTPAPP